MDEYRNDGINGFVMTDSPGVSDKDDTMTLNGEEGLHVNAQDDLRATKAYEQPSQDDFAQTDYSQSAQDDYAQTGYSQSAQDDYAQTGYSQSAQDDYAQTGYSQSAQDDYAQTGYEQNYGQGGYASWANGETTFHKETRKERRQRRRLEKQQSKLYKVRKTVNFTRRSLAAFVICVCLASFVCGAGGSMVGNSIGDHDNSIAQTTQTSSSSSSNRTSGYDLASATGSNMTVQQINDAVGSSVVEIRTESAASDSWMQQYVTEGAGSGVIISEDGYIMTNNHVISGASKIKVTTSDGAEYSAELVGTDTINDVAVLKIDAEGLSPAVYGNSSELHVGDLAVAIGNPLGELGGTVTAGIISATDRQLAIDGKTMHLLQTDSSINPGNSGGGLFNGDGQLIGLVVAKSSGSDVEGLGFAIPINTAAESAQQIIDQGYVSNQPFTGMSYTEASDSVDGFDMFFGSQSSSTYVYIYSVESREAKQAGFMAGDIVLAIDGEQISSFEDLQAIVTSHKVGDKLKYEIERNGQNMTLTLVLQERTN